MYENTTNIFEFNFSSRDFVDYCLNGFVISVAAKPHFLILNTIYLHVIPV